VRNSQYHARAQGRPQAGRTTAGTD
jgi:hypothetical protein